MHGKDTSLGFQRAQCKSALLIWKTLWKTLITRRYIFNFSLYSSINFHLTMIKLRNEFQPKFNVFCMSSSILVNAKVWRLDIEYSDICFDVLKLELHKTGKKLLLVNVFFSLSIKQMKGEKSCNIRYSNFDKLQGDWCPTTFILFMFFPAFERIPDDKTTAGILCQTLVKKLWSRHRFHQLKWMDGLATQCR